MAAAVEKNDGDVRTACCIKVDVDQCNGFEAFILVCTRCMVMGRRELNPVMS
jgi:hypothetical protein